MPFRQIKLVTYLIAAFTFACSVWYLLQKFQWEAALGCLEKTNFPLLIALVFASNFGYITVRAWRWRLAIRKANPEIRFLDLYWITAIIVTLSMLTPGQLGEALKIELLKRRGLLGRLPGFGAFAIERILDILLVATMGILGLTLDDSALTQRYPGLKIGGWGIIGAGILAGYILLRFDPGGSLSHWLARLRNGTGSPRTWIGMGILTFFSWTFVGIGWQISLSAVNVHLSLPEILWLISLVTLASLLSFIPGGIGVAEVFTAEALASMGIDPITAQAGALILRAFALIAIGYGMIHLLLWPLLSFPKSASSNSGTRTYDHS